MTVTLNQMRKSTLQMLLLQELVKHQKGTPIPEAGGPWKKHCTIQRNQNSQEF